MPSTATALHNSIPPQRENLRPVSSSLQRGFTGPDGDRSNHAPLPQLHTGTIKFFNPEKSYGMIEALADGPDVFYYLDAIQKPFERSALKFSTKVEYEQVDTKRGPRATKVWLGGGK